MTIAPGVIRDEIDEVLARAHDDMTVSDIHYAVMGSLGKDVPRSSIQSSLRLRADRVERVGRGRYRLRRDDRERRAEIEEPASFATERGTVIHADCFDVLDGMEERSVHAIVSDPPYGVLEYSKKEQEKLRSGRGGVWRQPPRLDGVERSPLPRFTTLRESDIAEIREFFFEFGRRLWPVLVPGANVVLASNPLVAPWVSIALSEAGFELRGNLIRLVQTMRGGDRPKGHEKAFANVSVMPRSQWEPWIMLRKPLEGTVANNLTKWRTGGYMRTSDEKPFGDVIRSHPTGKKEREIAPHPSLKPQDLMRCLVKASLPLGEGVVFDPFCGAGSTIAAADAVGYESIGIERDALYFDMAKAAIPRLRAIEVADRDA